MQGRTLVIAVAPSAARVCVVYSQCVLMIITCNVMLVSTKELSVRRCLVLCDRIACAVTLDKTAVLGSI